MEEKLVLFLRGTFQNSVTDNLGISLLQLKNLKKVSGYKACRNGENHSDMVLD